MKFNIDNQTMEDLEIFSKNESRNSIFNFFNLTRTDKGSETLKEILRFPFTHYDDIVERQQVLLYLEKLIFKLTIDQESLSFIEHYLKYKDKPEYVSVSSIILSIIKQTTNPSHPDLYIKKRGVHKILELLRVVDGLFPRTIDYNTPKFIIELNHLSIKIKEASNQIMDQNGSYFALEKLDFLFRNTLVHDITVFLSYVYTLDAYCAILESKAINGLVFPSISDNPVPNFQIKEFYHPFIKAPIKNDLSFDKNKLCFITGGNMAGKSTFLKSIAIVFYLGHLGFPVPASKMEMTVFDGLVTAINLPDNLDSGISHFYQEVLRLKKVITEIENKKKTFVIFDELFRGTNLKDAHLASRYIIDSFSKIKTSLFIISSHLIDVANELSESKEINFLQMETLMENNTPIYTFKLKSGINSERLGMWILKKESVFEMLDKVLATVVITNK